MGIIYQDTLPSVANLPAELIIDDLAELPEWRINGKHATLTTWPPWVYGPTLSITGSGSSPIVDLPSPLVGTQDGVCETVYQSKYYLGQFGTAMSGLDIAHEFVIKTPPPGTIAAIIYNDNTNGWRLYYNSVSIALIWYQGGAAVVYNYTSIPPGAWHHLFYVLDYGASTYGWLQYVNGIYANRVDDVTGVTSIAIKNIVTYNSGNGSAQIAYAAQWQRNGWFPGGASNKTQLDALVATRYDSLLTT
jgi:hypothetical protein